MSSEAQHEQIEQQKVVPGKVSRNLDTATEFAAFCVAERERRSNSDQDFDAEVFDEAVQLIVHKLQALKAEGF
ncbi:hypothetical protein [Piscinibacter sakaiensis]|uniref:hypothetical protein n=1 Tax=Piscinibacter sakaiensis TaxID=1547922 RepID=UPI003AAF74AA